MTEPEMAEFKAWLVRKQGSKIWETRPNPGWALGQKVSVS
jgi:hypothetical protein